MFPPTTPVLPQTLEIDNTQSAQQETEPIWDQFIPHVQTSMAQSASVVGLSSVSPDINETVGIPDDVSTQSETEEAAPIQLMASQSKTGKSTKKNQNITSNAYRGGDLYRDFPPIDREDMLPKDVKQAQKDFLSIERVKVTNTHEAPWLIAAITWYFSHQRLIRTMNGNPENLSAQRIFKLRNQVKQYRKRLLQAQQLLKPDAFQALMPIIRALFPNATQNFIIEEFDRRKARMLKYLKLLEPKCEGDLQKLITDGLGRLKGNLSTQDPTVDLPDPAPRKRKGHPQKDNSRVATNNTSTQASDTINIHSNPPAAILITSHSPSYEELRRRIESQEKELESLRKQLHALEAGNPTPNN